MGNRQTKSKCTFSSYFTNFTSLQALLLCACIYAFRQTSQFPVRS
jgi:hypothetical protein